MQQDHLLVALQQATSIVLVACASLDQGWVHLPVWGPPHPTGISDKQRRPTLISHGVWCLSVVTHNFLTENRKNYNVLQKLLKKYIVFGGNRLAPVPMPVIPMTGDEILSDSTSRRIARSNSQQ